MPDFHRRNLLKTAGVALAGTGSVAAHPRRRDDDDATFVLVHGGWHGAWCYGRVVPRLAARGHRAIAVDLPGHGLKARFPASYARRPVSREFAIEPSPLAAVTIGDYADSVIATIDALRARGRDKVVLVGHSMGGIVLNAVGERAPEKIEALVYLAANMPASDVPIGVYFGLAEAASALVNPALIGDPSATGAFRIDPRQPDPAYRASLKQAFYNDLDDADFEAATNLLTPDMPYVPMVTPITLTARRWGALPRHYIVCTQDHAVPIPLAERFIADADALTPRNRTRVHRLETSHSPFLSAPEELARLLDSLA